MNPDNYDVLNCTIPFSRNLTLCDASLKEYCKQTSAWSTLWQISPRFGKQKWFCWLAFASGLCYAAIGAAIYFNKELQVHPMKLLMYTSFVEAALFFNLFSSYDFCELKLQNLLAITLFFVLPSDGQGIWL